MKKQLEVSSVFAVLWFLVPAVTARAEPLVFDFKDPKGVNGIVFVLDSKLEPIVGMASGTSGEVSFDPDDPKKTSGRIVVDASTLRTPNQGMDDALHGPDWLNVSQYPTIEFTFKKIKSAKSKPGRAYEMKVQGDLTCKGVTKEITVPVKVHYLPDMLGSRLRGKEGDLLVLRGDFSINRRDFNIKPDMGGEVVAEDVELRVSIVGLRPTS